MLARFLALSILALAACRDATASKPVPAASVESPAPPAPVPADDYVPAEFKAGAARWKDTGVYVDGRPIGFLTFGELPVTLKPTWVKDKVSTNKPAGCPACPAWKWSQQRFYRFTDYLKALGIPISKIKAMHVYGPKLSQSVVVTAKDLLSKRADGFMFRFGTNTAGKALPWVPAGFGNGKTPDKISGVMIYIERTPPTVTRDGIVLDGVPQTGVPYYGEPIRGGVRVYVDDKLAAIIKRQDLDAKSAIRTPDGELHWNVAAFLSAHGVDTSKLVEGWVIRNERRTEQLAWPTLAAMTFTASSQAKGGVLLGDAQIRANAIALHTRHVGADELPTILPDEQ